MDNDLRALAHPLRLRMLSLLNARSLSAAQLARELDIGHGLATYHLRQLARAGLVVLDSERTVRGGRERTYRYRPPAADSTPGPDGLDPRNAPLWAAALGEEMRRRAHLADPHAPALTVDAELWVDPEAWRRVRDGISALLTELHHAAQPPGSPGAVRTSTTTWLFGMSLGETVSTPPPASEPAEGEG